MSRDQDFEWNKNQWRLEDSARRRGLALIDTAKGKLDVSTLAASEIKAYQIRYLTRHDNAPSGEPIITASGRGDNRVYRFSVVTPETRPGVLCMNCWRTPRPDSPIFPEWYREP